MWKKKGGRNAENRRENLLFRGVRRLCHPTPEESFPGRLLFISYLIRNLDVAFRQNIIYSIGPDLEFGFTCTEMAG